MAGTAFVGVPQLLLVLYENCLRGMEEKRMYQIRVSKDYPHSREESQRSALTYFCNSSIFLKQHKRLIPVRFPILKEFIPPVKNYVGIFQL